MQVILICGSSVSASEALEAVVAGSKVPPAKTIQSAWEQSTWLTLVPPTTEVVRLRQVPSGQGMSSEYGMPCALTCAGVGAAAGDGEAFSEPRALARAVAVELVPAPLAAGVPVRETGDAEACVAVRSAEDAEGIRFEVASTMAETTTPAVTPSVRSRKALPERLAPDPEAETAVEDPGFVSGPQGGGDGRDDADGLGGAELAALEDLGQGASVTAFHDQVGTSVGQYPRVDQRDRVRVPTDPAGRRHLPHEASTVAFVVQWPGVDLDGHRTPR